MTAIHDAVYATPPPSWEAFRWRMQHIAEEGVGRRVREARANEDAAFKKLNS